MPVMTSKMSTESSVARSDTNPWEMQAFGSFGENLLKIDSNFLVLLGNFLDVSMKALLVKRN